MLLQGRETGLSAGGRLKPGDDLTEKGQQSLPPIRSYSVPLVPVEANNETAINMPTSCKVLNTKEFCELVIKPQAS